jgi:outer membrane receptor protein involved in Fe transport
VKANVSLSYYLNTHWTLGWRTTYFDSYKQAGAAGDPVYNGVINPTPITTSTLPQGRGTIPEQMYHNIFASYHFGATQKLRMLNGVTLQLGINDLFNSAPPFDANASYAPYYYSPFGARDLRTYILKIRRAF